MERDMRQEVFTMAKLTPQDQARELTLPFASAHTPTQAHAMHCYAHEVLAGLAAQAKVAELVDVVLGHKHVARL